MTFISENVIPGNHGRVFTIDVKREIDLDRVKNKLMKLHAISSVIINNEVYPVEMTIQTDRVIAVKTIQEVMNSMGFHAIPKEGFFEI
ncbi:MAG: hypothetical protein CR985_00570 [Flavobacteriales bacterium]|nr:MAG: hypothetical protein CR985_00570 [Flavobacteriales bacterium]